MINKNLFFVLLVIGLFGRWIVVPSLKRLEAGKAVNKINSGLGTGLECMKLETCTALDLSNPIFLESSRVNETRAYLKKHFESLYSYDGFNTFHLLGQLSKVSKNEDEEKLFLKSLSSKNLHAFGLGLYHCNSRDCRDYVVAYEASLKEILSERTFLLLKIKSDDSWELKNRYLDRLLEIIEKEQEYSLAVSLIEFIPNHPRLRKFLEKYYLYLIGQKNIDRAAVHLSRYNPGWHDRTYKEILNSGLLAHIDAYITTMKIDCPSRLNDIYSGIEKLSKQSQALAKEEAYYLLNATDSLAKKLNLDPLKFVSDSKCHRPFEEI
ncbi:hypothetical protein [Bacteriovorax sp. Seq25_V]|uniref:hypothetical protein n=1 Tax=Bacteriovorax sp. Seq25_V TaxID=1201288 RepID=UPI00038A520D|nr:hypothetical protein [Bacteriovorax sp. Seq25_V]EQC45988.1 hypothetical protein M900_1715 [Bacteriovorax sp. Seq25_V]